MVTFMKLDRDLYLVYSPAFHTETHDVYYQGQLEDAKAVLEWCNIPGEEIDYALQNFAEKHHNYADFGLNNTVTFTRSVFTRPGVKAAA